MSYFAEVETDQIVQRVVVAPNIHWCETNLGGIWVETSNPYDGDDPNSPNEATYAGKAMGCADNLPERFSAGWVMPTPDPETGDWSWYAKDAIVFHLDRLWISTFDDNTYEPGVSGWHDAPIEGYPQWIQPTGGHDAYQIDDKVTHNGLNWNCNTPDCVWEPSVYGWDEIV